MKEFIKKHAKAYMILSICLLVGVVGVSYAYYAASVSNDTVVVGQAGGGNLPLLTISKVSTEANDNLIPIDMDTTTLTKAASASPKCVDNNGYSSCQIYSVTVQNNSTITQSYNVNLTRVSGPTTPNVDAVTMGASDSAVTNAASIKNNGLICTTNSVENGETTEPCYFMVLIKNLDEAQTDSGTFTGTVTITSTAGAELKADFGVGPIGEKLTTKIANLYNDAEKTEVKHNDITYNYANSVSLMNDRLGGTTTSLDDGNIRYYGFSPDNYIDIGNAYEQDTVKGNWENYAYTYQNSSSCYDNWNCSKYYADLGFDTIDACELNNEQTLAYHGLSSVDELCSTSTILAGTPILYRIIGLFKDVELADGTTKDLIKVIRNESIGLYSWDQSPEDINDGNGINEWSQADLMKLLNPGYEDEQIGGSLYWNSGSGLCYGWDTSTKTYTAVPCNFTNTGLSTNVRSNIETVKWNLGGCNDYRVFANNIYQYERGDNVYQMSSESNYNDTVTRTTIWPGKVALPYLSDYGYAADFNSCTFYINSYESSSCKETNWMYNTLISEGVGYSFLLIPHYSWADSVFVVNLSGYNDCNAVRNHNGISPVFYLDSELTVERGTGKSDDPYVLS